MAVHNAANFVRDAVASVLAQSWRNLELVIVLDAPTDGSDRVLEEFTDARIRLLRNPRNLGQAASLRRALSETAGAYIARLDADDVALPRRLETQVAYLEAHPGVGLLGSACHVIDEAGRRTGTMSWPESDLEIRWRSLLGNPFGHPTVMLRREVLDRHALNYDPAFDSAQDYELWTRVMAHTAVANLAEPLVQYRIHGGGVTASRREEQLRNHDAIATRTIRAQLPELAITPAEVTALREFFVGGAAGPAPDRGARLRLARRYLALFARFAEQHRLDPSLGALRRREAVRIARVWASALFGRGWVGVAVALHGVCPAWPIVAAGAWSRRRPGAPADSQRGAG
jgi:glycosyltransferase involved in cell wall biosynthesis